MKQLKAALFDLDGVVFDTEPQYTIFWGSQCREFHPERPGLEHEIKGSTLDQIYSKWFAGELVSKREEITRRLDEFEANMTFDYLNGFLPFLSDLRANGVKTAVVTSSNQPKMESVYRNHPEFKSLFDAILTSEDFSESKPSPDCYLKAAKRLDVSPSQCMVFEDSFNGLRSGCAAKMFVVGITTTNPATAIRELSNLQVADYTELSFNKLELIFNL